MGTSSMSRAGEREAALFQFYRERRREKIDPLTANELTNDHAKFLDELELIRAEMEKVA